MFLHLGADVVVNDKDVVAIMDLETTSISKITREYLQKAEKENDVITVSYEDLPKSYVVVKNKNERKVYISPISSATLLKRSEK